MARIPAPHRGCTRSEAAWREKCRSASPMSTGPVAQLSPTTPLVMLYLNRLSDLPWALVRWHEEPEHRLSKVRG